MRNTSLHFHAKLAQLCCYKLGCTHLLVAKFRMLMNFASPADDLIENPIGFNINGIEKRLRAC